MDVDNEKVDAEMASNSEDENSSDDEKNEAELHQKRDILQERVLFHIRKYRFMC